ncbi:ANTAR domain-containing protein [Promicromonospora thailandica]|nr:ANTAR domain-containing protein [Promicromonospora thailandica]
MSLSSASERLTMRIAEPAFAQIEDLQAVLGEGPALLAFAEGRTVVTHLGATADLSTELTADVAADGAGRSGSRQADASAFPMFTAMAAAIEGAVSVYAVPMRPLGRVIGVLTLYLRGDVRGGRLARSLEEAEFLADAAGAALLGDPDTFDVGTQPWWPQRARVHQATGVVTAQLGIPPADALAVLRAHAFGRASSLESVVDDILDRTLTFSHDGTDPGTGGIVTDQDPRTEEP